MGVHGLTGLLGRSGVVRADDPSAAIALAPGSTLAIDGNGLVFHIFRLAYHRHRKSVLSTWQEKSLRAQSLLPTFTPLKLVDEVATSYLLELTATHGMHLRIFFDGPDQRMKWRARGLRKERREDDWENVRQLCVNGVMPEEGGGTSKFRSSARRQAREHERRANTFPEDGGDDDGDEDAPAQKNKDLAEVEMYLSSFPHSPLVLNQIERSVWAFADTMGTLLPQGSIEAVQCEGEADADVARASAADATGGTYALAHDSDYLIYGFDGSAEGRSGGAKYVTFGQVDPFKETLRAGGVLTRSSVAEKLGLPSGAAMVELSVLLGNDYTGPLLRHNDRKKCKMYWESLRWRRAEKERGSNNEEGASTEGEKLPPEDELSRFDAREVVEHVAEKAGEGMTLTSDNEELRAAIEFSYALYSFGDISRFPSTAPGSAMDENASDEESTEDHVAAFPSLPRGFDLSLAGGFAPANMEDLCEASLFPLKAYMTDIAVESNGMSYVEQNHVDAFQMMFGRMTNGNRQETELPHRTMKWGDMQALYVLERCLLEAIDGDRGAVETMPFRVFDHAVFRSCLENLSPEDFPPDNGLAGQSEESFWEETTGVQASANKKEEEPVKNLVLPIDEHKDEILHTIKTQRVTIIHGETGCGKSSRVPCFLLRADPPEPTRAAPEVKMVVSQPRRIAAKALAERVRSCEPDLADRIGLRMGHGVREHETSRTRAWFVTTGYVVRLLANYPGWFYSHTHLIIDEVHERSVDTDILCLLCRRLLQSHPTIRLVLMSATMAAELYCQYFGSPQPPIHVGARRFPIREVFVEDLSSHLSLSSKSIKIAREVFQSCEKTRCTAPPSANNMQKLYHLATQIAASVGGGGSSVLIFVPGMSDIEAIIELIEILRVNETTFVCLPIHSDVPFEEQMAAFEPPQEGEVKVIVATNAAESSLTLPDVDHVICLGLCKQIVYNRASHRQMLVPTWISKASATQRAGRTGRVREGNVYRLYSRNTFNIYMQPFDEGELVRTPLDSTILSLREMLNEAVTPILLDCLEPPDVSNIERSFQSLHTSNFISDPSDDGEITSLGSLVVSLGIDLTLGALVGLGIQFGVTNEAIQLAAILSFPQSPWARSSPMYHDIDTFNEIISKTFTSRCFFDGGLFSEPLAIANLLHDYFICKDRGQFCWKHRVSQSRMRHLSGTVLSLKRRVAECLNISAELLEVEEPPRSMSKAKISILRILQVWLFPDTMIAQNPSSSKNKIESVNGILSVQLDGPPIRRTHLEQILDTKRHPFELVSRGKSMVQGSFDPGYLQPEDGTDYFQSFEIRFTSYLLEKDIDLSFYFIGNSLRFFMRADIWERPENAQLRQSIMDNFSPNIKEVNFLQNTGSGNQRGRQGRTCGAWHVAKNSSLANGILRSVVILSSQLTKSQAKEFKKNMDPEKINSVNSMLSCNIQLKRKVLFSLTFSGDCQRISSTDLGDLFAAPDVTSSNGSSTMKQCVKFPLADINLSEGESIYGGPLIKDSPEGARLLSVLASERRRDNFIRFSDGPNSDEDFIDVNLSKAYSINGKKWKRKDGGGMVFVPENCVPVAAIPTSNSHELFCCCANTLELRGGACRVEGITMLPSGRLFVGLALLSFGINPRTGCPISSFDTDEFLGEEKKEAGEGNRIVQDVLGWIYEKGNIPFFQQDTDRVVEALHFHASCMELGEKLECQPDKIVALCALFDGVNGVTMNVWEGYDVSLQAAMTTMRRKTIRQVRTDKSAEREKPSAESMAKETDRDEQPRETWVCPSCKEMFGKKKKCEKHIKKCCFGLVKQTKPKLMYTYSGCSEMFKSYKKCRSHMKACSTELVATNAALKKVKKKKS